MSTVPVAAHGARLPTRVLTEGEPAAPLHVPPKAEGGDARPVVVRQQADRALGKEPARTGHTPLPGAAQSLMQVQSEQLGRPISVPRELQQRLLRIDDHGLRQAFAQLYCDGHLSRLDVRHLINAASDRGGVSRTERRDLERLLRHPKVELSHEGRAALEAFLGHRPPATRNPPLEHAPLGELQLSIYDMHSAYRHGETRFLQPNDATLKNYLASPSWTTDYPLNGIGIQGEQPWDKLLFAFRGDARSYAFLARIAELGDPKGTQLARDFVAHAQAHGIALTGPYGRDDRDALGPIPGAWDVENTVRNLARLVKAGGGDPSCIQIQLAPGAELIPLAQHPYYPGGLRPAAPKVPVVLAAPLGDVKLAKTYAELDQQSKSGALLCADDAAIRSMTEGQAPTLLQRVVRENADHPGRYHLMARAAELWSRDQGVDARTDRWRPETEIRRFFAETLPRTQVHCDDLPGLVRMTQAAGVPVHLTTYRDDHGQKARLTDHPDWSNFVARHT